MTISDSNRPPPPPRAASVVDLQHTPVTLGVVLAVQAVAMALALLVAGVVWGRISIVENRIEALSDKVDARFDVLHRDNAALRQDIGELKALLQKGQP